MTINYPIRKKSFNVNTSSKVSSPIPKKDGVKSTPNMANRGMNLEGMINDSNDTYRALDRAIIHKKPTPVQIVKVDYPSRNKAVITEAYYKTPSTTDYNGIYRGKYIDFEAKENKNKTSFPLANVHPHQVSHLDSIYRHGGIGFLIVYWIHTQEFFLYPIDRFKPHYDAYLKDGRKSITYEDFKNEAYLIKEGYSPRLDFLSVVDEYLL